MSNQTQATLTKYLGETFVVLGWIAILVLAIATYGGADVPAVGFLSCLLLIRSGSWIARRGPSGTSD